MARKFRCCLDAQCIDPVVVRRAFGAAVPTVVVVRAIAIFLAVRLVMFLVVAHEIAQREAVVSGDEIEARARAPAIVCVEIAAAGQSRGQLADRAAVAFPKAPHAVAILAVPLGPEHGKIADLIAVRPEIPRLGDELHLREHRVLVDDIEKRAEAIDLPQLAGERAGEIEAEAIDVHFQHPIAQRIHDELQRARVRDVERIAASGEIDVARAVVGQPVVGGVIDAAQRKRWARADPLRRCDCRRHQE